MVLYESHSVIHGRPFPLIGKFFANVFIHFEPVYEEGNEGILPPYILEGSSEAEEWRRKLEQETNYASSESVRCERNHFHVVVLTLFNLHICHSFWIRLPTD